MKIRILKKLDLTIILFTHENKHYLKTPKSVLLRFRKSKHRSDVKIGRVVRLDVATS